MTDLASLRVAVVHDWIMVLGGAERVLEQILQVVPQADLYSLFDGLPRADRHILQNKPVRTSFLSRIPGAAARYRSFLPLMPLAVEQFDFSGYDLVISSSYAVCKGILTGPDTLHVSYVHSPMRYAWDLQAQYLHEAGLEHGVRSGLARALLHYIRLWDASTAHRVDEYLCNSHFVARRIQKCYGRTAEVIPPPVDVDWYVPGTLREDYFVTASRLVPYKKMDLIVQAFAGLPDRRLVVLGDGPEMERVRRQASSNVVLEGQVDRARLRHHLQRAQAFVFAALEDFGIVVVEAQACGTPIIGYGAGGVLETVVDGETGLLFPQQTVSSLQAAIQRFDTQSFSPGRIRRHAEQFRVEHFRQAFRTALETRWAAFQSRQGRTGADSATGAS